MSILSLSLTQQEEVREEHREDKAEESVGDGAEKLAAVNDDGGGSSKEESQSSPLPASEKGGCEGEDSKTKDKEVA